MHNEHNWSEGGNQSLLTLVHGYICLHNSSLCIETILYLDKNVRFVMEAI